jgi:hypothetical protein
MQKEKFYQIRKRLNKTRKERASPKGSPKGVLLGQPVCANFSILGG